MVMRHHHSLNDNPSQCHTLDEVLDALCKMVDLNLTVVEKLNAGFATMRTEHCTIPHVQDDRGTEAMHIGYRTP